VFKKQALKPVLSYPDEPGFIAALARLTKVAYEEAERFGKPRVLFSAHGLPERIVRRGDPYPDHCARTVEALRAALAIPDLDGVLCFQSRAGPLRWTGPSTEDEMKKAARAKRPVLVVPLSFVAENLETTVELDQECRKRAMDFGAPFFARVPVVGTAPEFIDGLARLVQGALRQPPEGKG
jgi:ferrochelatase